MDHFSREFIVVYIRVVQGCNLNCAHCFTLGNRDEFRLAPLTQIQQYLESIKKNINPQKAVFYIHGGETFLAPLEYLKQVNDLIRQTFADIRFDIIPQTNLMYQIDDKYIQFVREEYEGHLGVSWDHQVRFQTTASGLSEDLFLSNFRKLAQAQVEMAVAITVQKNLLGVDPAELLKKFEGAKSIDFEFLTIFDEKTQALKVKNEEWSRFFMKIVEFYGENETTWSLPQVDLFTKSFLQNQIYQCKCNCCQHRTFTMNVNGSVGLCPDDTYINPISSVSEMAQDWAGFAKKALVKHIEAKAAELPQICQSCDYFDYCGGNCEPSLFNEGEKDCPMSQLALGYQFQNINKFVDKLEAAKKNLAELKVKGENAWTPT